MNLDEIDEMWPKLCTRLDGIRTQSELETHIAKIMDEGFDPYKKMWPLRILLVPEMDDGKGRVIMYATHAFSDGTQILATLLLISEKKDPS